MFLARLRVKKRQHIEAPESAAPLRGACRADERNTSTLQRGGQSLPNLQSVSRSAIDLITLPADFSAGCAN